MDRGCCVIEESGSLEDIYKIRRTEEDQELDRRSLETLAETWTFP